MLLDVIVLVKADSFIYKVVNSKDVMLCPLSKVFAVVKYFKKAFMICFQNMYRMYNFFLYPIDTLTLGPKNPG